MKAPPLPPLSSGIRYAYGDKGERICVGAAMGIADTLPPREQRTQACKLRLVRMRWVSGDYLPNGAYFGATRATSYGRAMGKPLDWIYRAIGDCGDVRAELFTRASSRAQARANVSPSTCQTLRSLRDGVLSLRPIIRGLTRAMSRVCLPSDEHSTDPRHSRRVSRR